MASATVRADAGDDLDGRLQQLVLGLGVLLGALGAQLLEDLVGAGRQLAGLEVDQLQLPLDAQAGPLGRPEGDLHLPESREVGRAHPATDARSPVRWTEGARRRGARRGGEARCGSALASLREPAPRYRPRVHRRPAADDLTTALGGPHDVAVVMGSGWAPAADAFGAAELRVAIGELPGFAAPDGGRATAARCGRCGSATARCCSSSAGRTSTRAAASSPVVHGVRTAAAAGVKTVVLTNAAGGLAPEHRVGQAVDHRRPPQPDGPLPAGRARTFVDLTDLYSARLRELARSLDPALTEGVYAALPGPHYETPAEIRMLRTMGADLVGMSTALEAIAAHAEGLEVFGLSLVTNAAAGVTGEKLDADEVIAAGKEAAGRLGQFLVRAHRAAAA